ncbi:hypothetical protein B0H11DRAFT_2227268 [Mycena galericulata]|nr:hypothetical protein B0H11DRAFT_2227268 [Mycena galericulata]
MSSSKTVVAVSAPRARAAAPKARAPMTAEQKKDKKVERDNVKEAIDEAVGEWFLYTHAKANELAKRFDLKPRYFLDIFFQGSAHMVNHQEKINPYNVFKNEKATERRMIVLHLYLPNRLWAPPPSIEQQLTDI